jgi:hypothetical protein
MRKSQEIIVEEKSTLTNFRGVEERTVFISLILIKPKVLITFIL